MDDADEESFGQRRPPLSVFIKSILERYPDGQIFKEMIQNADDAGAKTVQFYIDHREHGTASLPHPELAKLQGPALISANDACFMEEDWEGIQKLQQSIKAEDPFKVGRFGIGFNSVYHVTDVPIIISGERVGFLDPQEKIWPRESGKRFKLTYLQTNYSDVLVPFDGIAGFDSQNSPKFPKTLFRFPLRKVKSGLSENVYTIEMVQELMDALRKEAKYLLLFLRSVVTVEVYNILPSGVHSLNFKVSVTPGSKSELVKKRSKFLRRLKKAFASDKYSIVNCIEFFADFHVELFNPMQMLHTQSSRWLVTSIVGCSNPGSEVLELAKKQHVFPWVGAALEIAENPDSGRIFCFLPMPIETSSGYPVHVNATFSINDDRRSLKWPGVERKNDPAAKWNDLIVNVLLPPCYATLLLEAVKTLPFKDFYRTWPNVKSVSSPHWKKLLLPLFELLFKESILWSEDTASPHQSGWVSLAEATFVCNGTTLPPIVYQCLCKCGIRLVSIPQSIWAALQYAQLQVKKVTPKLARGQLRSKPYSYSTVNDRDKLELLSYCVSDRQYNELRGLQLLPLANGSFIAFEQTQASPVFLCTSANPKYLLPNLEHQLVDPSSNSIIENIFLNIAKSKKTQLALLTETDVARLLSKEMNQNWKGKEVISLPDSNFTVDWFQKFWEWAHNKTLKLFEGLFIIPIHVKENETDNIYVVQLKKKQPLIYISNISACPEPFLLTLESLRIKCCMESEFPYVHHNKLLAYLKPFDTNGVLDCIHLASSSNLSLTFTEAKSLRGFISPESLSASTERVATLKTLCIFETGDNSSKKLYSLQQAEMKSVLKKPFVEPPNCCFSLKNLPSTIILFTQTDAFQQCLLKYLKVKFLTDTELLIIHIFPLVQRNSFPSQMLSILMKEVLDMFQVLQNSDGNFSDTLSKLRFVDIGSGHTRTPRELYDPTNSTLKELFKGEKVFPVAPFDSPKYINVLKQCGLQEKVSPQAIFEIIDTVSLSRKTEPQLVKKTKLIRAKAVLKYISSDEFVSSANGMYSVSTEAGSLPFKEALDCLIRKRSWIPVLAEQPPNYPKALTWKGSTFQSHFVCLSDNVFFSTSAIHTHPLIVGSQMYVPNPPLPTCVTDLFSTHKSQVPYIISHFKEIISCVDKIPPDSMSFLVDSIYRFLNEEWINGRSQNELLQLKQVPEWIYIKKCNKFVGPEVVALEHNSSFRHDLEPYLWIVPESLLPYKSFLVENGVSEHVSKSQILSVLGMVQKAISSSDTTLNKVRTWGTVMSILNWITADGTVEADLSDNDILYVPVESDESLPKLMEAEEVVYTDNDFLKDFLQSSDLEEEHFNFVHNRVHSKLAEHLGLSPLSEQLDISEDTFEDTGQQEPLTVRLKSILRDYKDGLTIIKELLQNADDAEATEVNICYDSRKHNVAEKSLFFPGMLEAHGPALIVHNNKTFTEEDFDNITKLGGATKLNKPLKIGKFGIGFCSVYHITDVPSFVSQDKLFIFDPTLKCLHKEIKNPALPGKKVKFASKFISRSKQLIPYDGLFGFNSQEVYNGTMFRFPFRSSASELSGTCYTESTVKDLVNDIQTCGSKLLLFLQHVKCLTFQQIDEGDDTPRVLLSISKEIVQLPNPAVLPKNLQKMKCTIKPTLGEPHSELWLITSDSSFINGRNANASIGCLLKTSSDDSNLSVAKLKGETFCYLPLSRLTGLPVHVSSNFAVMNNRVGIWTTDEATSRTNAEVEWNIALMVSVIPNAYHSLLVSLQILHESGNVSEYSFHSLWPLGVKLKQRQPWENLINALYNTISKSKLFYSANTNLWLYLGNSKFLRQDILQQSSESATTSGTPKSVLDVLEYLKIPIVELPDVYYVYFNLTDKMITDLEFINLFFRKLKYFSDITKSRNAVILCLLEEYGAEYDAQYQSEKFHSLSNFFQEQPSIPSSPDGQVLKHCRDLVDPEAVFAKLFDSQKNHYPASIFTSNRRAKSALCALGMITSKLPWKMLIERAQESIHLYNSDKIKGLKHVKLILETLNSHIDTKSPKADVGIESIKFLPVLTKPSGYPVSWGGRKYTLLCGKDLMIAGPTNYGKQQGDINVKIAGSQVAFVSQETPDNGGCECIPYHAKILLKIRNYPTCIEVVKHFQEFIIMFNSQTTRDSELIDWADVISKDVYSFLDRHLTVEKEDQKQMLIDFLLDLPCVWTGKDFINVKLIAKNWKLPGPYLYPVPTFMSDKEELICLLQIKEQFTQNDMQCALEEMKDKFGDKPIDDACRVLFTELIPSLHKIKPDQFSNFLIVLPDEHFIMRYSSELAYNDAPWAPKDEDYVYVNGIIPRDLAKQLQVRPVRSRLLDKYTSSSKTYWGVEFGQREELTRRIQNILREYPFDITVLKELLQNADDAKAKKMYIILDKRTHGTETILSEEWQNLQGPALLVWNDSTFSEKDLKGIQELGLGSKRSDAESIGQYGIGFNVVYHLTDCPSFVSGGETLCILDPHCHFVPGADPMNPGRRCDNLKSKGFWTEFPDMRSAYLRCDLSNGFEELREGSLFRFPLRHTEDLVSFSKLIEPDAEPLTADKMENKLLNWASDMKEAMLFLSNVTELRFFIIEKGCKTLVTKSHFIAEIDPSSQSSRDELYQKLKAFKKNGSEPCVVHYPLTITDISHSGTDKESKTKVKWLIQQGVGDINNQQQTWRYITNVRPRHGIAAPLSLPEQNQADLSLSRKQKFIGKVFCFLPLPVISKLPVHINGHFVLHSNRRDLWHSTDSEHVDDRTQWNMCLLKALASSYAKLLMIAQKYCITADAYKFWKKVKEDIDLYYEIFPKAMHDELDEMWLTFAKDVYCNLLKHNARILAIVKQIDGPQTGNEKYQIEWHYLSNSEKSSQVHFWLRLDNYDRKTYQPILEKIGLKVTAAPYIIRKCFNSVIKASKNQLPHTTPHTVFMYYSHYNRNISSQAFPVDIKDTTLGTVDNFKILTKYLLIGKEENDYYEFPSSPFGCPLLLTVDGKLRVFDKHCKILRSSFLHLFQSIQSKFLHSQLLDIKYSSDYFLCSTSVDDIQPGLKLTLNILDCELPSALKAKHVNEADDFISTDTLAKLWECFLNDPVFKVHLPSVLKVWALILTTENVLYSISSLLLPVCPPSSEDEYQTILYEVMKQIKMPFVSIQVVTASPSMIYCPTLADNTAILRNLFYLNQEVDLSSLLTKEQVETLIKYLKTINFQITASCTHIRSLPLYETIDGGFSSISNKLACIWPPFMCKAGYKKWVQHYNVVFLKKDGAWTSLQATEKLSIERIHEEDVYTRYIFLKFSCMNEKERISHLKHIRDHMYRRYSIYRTSVIEAERFRAIEFLNALTQLPCLSSEGEDLLRPVSSFCSPDLRIFKVFPAHFRMLPKAFSEGKESSRWLEFFKGIGLRISITQNEYIQFCKETAIGRVEDIRKSSEVLVEYLFDEQAEQDNWHKNNIFLSQVSQIEFVCTEHLPKFSWIAPVVQPSNRVQKGNTTVNMTCFHNAVVSDQACLLWTVKPVITVSRFYSHLLSALKITLKPSIQDVLTNISNIATKGKFTSFKLFDNYPDTLKPPRNGEELMDVMFKMFNFLLTEQHHMTEKNKSFLSDLPCIPVFSTAKKTYKWQVVLVKPKFVLTFDIGSHYHPFLHQLPDKLWNVALLLKAIGVKNSLDMHHMQVLLQTAYECSDDQDLDVNTEECIKKALNALYQFLIKNKESRSVPMLSKADIQSALSPLYLPSCEKKLVLSTSLVHDDVSEFRSTACLDLNGTGLAKLGLSRKDYNFWISHFCNLLPEAIRPKLLTQICNEAICSECVTVSDCDTAKKLKQTLELNTIPTAVVLVVKNNTRDKELCAKLKPVLINILRNVKVITVQRLKTVFKMKESGREIGKVKTKFFFLREESRYILYLDSQFGDFMTELAISNLAEQLAKEIKIINPNITFTTSKEIEDTLKLLLRAQTADDVKIILGSKKIALDDADDEEDMEDLNFELGKKISECWHHRLDLDMNNIFHPMEYVGYQDEDGTIIFAQILYPILPEGAQDYDSVPRLEMKFKIRIEKDDTEGKTVSVLDLYKFTRGPKNEQENIPTDEEATAVVQYEGESDASKIRHQIKTEDLKTIKKEICKELEEIWKLPEDQKKKGIRRLYLKWHPDKNPDMVDIAEEAFKFLKIQIDRLEAGLPLDDPEGEASTPPCGSGSSSSWRQKFYEWANTARQQGRYYQRERSRNRNRRRSNDDFKPKKQPEEGRRWMRQAEANCKALNVLYEQVYSTVEVSCHCCFMAYQVAEKAMKGALYISCGLDDQGKKCDRMVLDANILNATFLPKTAGLVMRAKSLSKYSFSSTLQPSFFGNQVPADKYNMHDATQAKRNAEAVLQMMKDIAST